MEKNNISLALSMDKHSKLDLMSWCTIMTVLWVQSKLFYIYFHSCNVSVVEKRTPSPNSFCSSISGRWAEKETDGDDRPPVHQTLCIQSGLSVSTAPTAPLLFSLACFNRWCRALSWKNLHFKKDRPNPIQLSTFWGLKCNMLKSQM